MNANTIEQRIARLERMMYLLIGLQVPALIPLIGIL
jgi:hypothetical protein